MTNGVEYRRLKGKSLLLLLILSLLLLPVTIFNQVIEFLHTELRAGRHHQLAIVVGLCNAPVCIVNASLDHGIEVLGCTVNVAIKFCEP